MPADIRTIKALLRTCKDNADFDELELTVGDVTVKARRRTGPAVPDQAKPKKQAPPTRTAIDSLRDNPPVFFES